MSDERARERWRAISVHLDELLDLEDAGERAARLARLHADDPELAAEVDALLAAAEAPDPLLDTGAAAAATRLAARSPEPLSAGSPEPEWIGPWRVTGVLGEGGVGRVYAAERAGEGFVQRAAVKVLHGGAAPGLLRQRFLEERRILAELDHPGIARMLDGGVDAGGAPYLAMERVEGERMTDACRSLRLTVERRLELFLDVCAAVEHAHGRRVIHRDLKPSNVMVDREGRVRLLDFGIAKLLAADDAPADAPTLLRALTPQYAAPEQATGAAVTPATDVYALGVLLHELLAGRTPTRRDDGAPFTVERALAGDEPTPLPQAAVTDASRPEGEQLARRLTGDLDRIVAQAMAREPTGRYPSVAALAQDLRRHLAGLPVTARGRALGYRLGRYARRHRAALAIGLLAVAVVALALQTLAPASRRAAPAAAAGGARLPVVAVLSFAPLGDAEPWLATALSEGIASELGRTPGLAVLASTSLAGLRGDTASLERLRGELGATHAVTGSVQTEAETIRVRTSLIDLASRHALWSGQVDGEAGARLATQAELARRVAWELLDRLGGSPNGVRDERPATRDPRAYEAYLRGLAELSGRGAEGVGPEQRVAATVQLELAVALDPAFAAAWARLGTAYAKRLHHDALGAELEERSFIAVQRALALDPDLAEAYLARAQLSWTLPRGFDHAAAVADLQRAVALQPSLAEAHAELCKVYLHVGLTERAVAECDRALELDPRNRTVLGRKVTVLADAGRDAEVAALLAERGAELSAGARGGLLVDIGRNEEALALLRGEHSGGRARDPEFGWPSSSRAALERAWSAIALARLGRREEAAALLAKVEITAESVAEESHLHHAYYSLGAAHALLGERAEALRWLARAAAEGYPSHPRFANDADLAALAGDPEFEALLARLERDGRRWQREL